MISLDLEKVLLQSTETSCVVLYNVSKEWGIRCHPIQIRVTPGLLLPWVDMNMNASEWHYIFFQSIKF